MQKLLALLTAAGVLVACSSNHAPSQSAVASAPMASSSSFEEVSLATEATGTNAVYFAFDKYNVEDEYAALVKANAEYLASNPTSKVKVEGNTDDIGSVEYNLSLGQRRADAVKKALISDGASKKQIEAVSNGKMHPKFGGVADQSDDDRALNRRSDIIYTHQQPSTYSVGEDGVPHAYVAPSNTAEQSAQKGAQ